MKQKITFVCQNCGYKYPKWLGRCPKCQQFDTMVEEEIPADVFETSTLTLVPEPIPITDVEFVQEDRLLTHIGEVDRVFGAGIVRGSVNLVGGDPGIGKSTLTLQILDKIATPETKVLYITSEESALQVKIRAERLGIKNKNILISAETNYQIIKKQIEKVSPAVVVIDSIQMIYDPSIDSAPGMISQLRLCTTDLVVTAKKHQITMLIIGHVTKEGFIAGPKSLEHIVDAVFYFEGEKYQAFRILRSVKNRYGSTSEVGLFEMTSSGLVEVPNPSLLFISQDRANRTGSVIVPYLVGTRTLLVEVQALTSRMSSGYPARRVSGVDFNRSAMIIAVIERRLGISLQQEDVYINAVGGVKLDEPCADLGIAVAIVSSMLGKSVDAKTVIIGEVGLAGEIRGVPHVNLRVMEAKRLGFETAIIPKDNIKSVADTSGLNLHAFSYLYDVLAFLKIL